MKPLFFALALATSAPVLAQTSSLVIPVNITQQYAQAGHITMADETFGLPAVPGHIVDYHWDLTFQYSGDITIPNQYPDAREVGGTVSGWTGHYYFNQSPLIGLWTQAFTSNLIPANGVEVQPFSNSHTFTGTFSEDIRSGITLDTPLKLGSHTLAWTIPNWYSCLPGGLDCQSDYLYPQYSNLSLSITGTLTYDYLPYLSGVYSVCDGDGVMRLKLVGDWQGEVRAATPAMSFGMCILFRGDTWTPWPGSTYCIARGQRIHESLNLRSIDYIVPPATLTAGQSFALQAAWRQGSPFVYLTNALWVTPQ